VFQPRRRLDRAMVNAAWTQAADADVIVHLVDAAAQARVQAGAAASAADRAAGEDVARILEGLRRGGRRALLALNKVDAMPRPALLRLAQELFASDLYAEVFMISALAGDGVEALTAALARAATPGPWLYPEDQIADAPVRVLAAEVTREALMLRLHEEIPYAATVETERFEERPDGSVRIEQTIFVERDSQRRIAIGEKARTLKAIGQAARLELAALLERPVHLFLHVKVREGWAEERARLNAMGLEE
jgi:GTP-binding protein Era